MGWVGVCEDAEAEVGGLGLGWSRFRGREEGVRAAGAEGGVGGLEELACYAAFPTPKMKPCGKLDLLKGCEYGVDFGAASERPPNRPRRSTFSYVTICDDKSPASSYETDSDFSLSCIFFKKI